LALRTASFISSLVIAALLLAGPAEPATRLKVQEQGFKVAAFGSCVLRDFGNLQVSDGLPIADAECSPGGAWGDLVYLAVFDLSGGGRDGVYTLDYIGKTSKLANVVGDGPVELAFSPATGAFGNNLWYISEAAFHGPAAVDANGQGSDSVQFEEPYGFAFDPTGAFGGGLFAYTPYGYIFPIGPYGPGIYSLADPEAQPVLFATSPAAIPRRFGPGGTWGTDLYATSFSPVAGWIIAPDGTATQFPFPFDEFDWMSGTGWEGDMFAICGANSICRVKPDGTSTVFATEVEGGAQLVSCGGYLWVLKTANCQRIAVSPSLH
jgi:hypothetical protein